MTNFFLSCAKGTEHVLLGELESFGAQKLKEGPGGVYCSHPDPLFYYRLNLQTRIAFRVFIPLAHFPAKNENELYRKTKEIDWSNYLDVSQTFAVQANCKSSFLTHSKYLALKVKDAVCDQFRERCGKRPSIDVNEPDLALNVFLNKNECTISLDSTGYSLHKRGYRISGKEAPLMETLAATLIKLSGWTADLPFYDLMCGSGTFSTEASLIARQISPAKLNGNFNFKRWPDFNEEKFSQVEHEIESNELTEFPLIYLNDINKENVLIAKRHLYKVGQTTSIHISQNDILEFKPETDKGYLILNPPYGIRLGDAEKIKSFYTQLNEKLKTDFRGFTMCILSTEESHLREIRMSPRKIYTVYNANLKCKFAIFDVF
ncbi:MAG: class I SAM-dependent RNA methyltransferase [Calditrichaeota bacterium]|nr:class I SAM-dependent RNA methyltransferase [Calditrichota bacterium]